jgi:hypothetical protein
MKMIIVLALIVLVTILTLGTVFFVKIAQIEYSIVADHHEKAGVITMARNAVRVPAGHSQAPSRPLDRETVAWLAPPDRLDGAPALPAPPLAVRLRYTAAY